MSELNFQSISNETTSFCNIAAENDLKILDETTLSFLKLCLYKNIKLEPNSIHKLFENYFIILSKNISFNTELSLLSNCNLSLISPLSFITKGANRTTNIISFSWFL